jgi:hypothetical protein
LHGQRHLAECELAIRTKPRLRRLDPLGITNLTSLRDLSADFALELLIYSAVLDAIGESASVSALEQPLDP